MAFHNVPPNGFPDIPDIEDLEAVQGDITALKTGKAPKTDIAAEFSATANYAVGDLVYKDGVLYECTTAHEAAAWAAGDFTAANVGTVASQLNSNLTSKTDQINTNLEVPTRYNLLDLNKMAGSDSNTVCTVNSDQITIATTNKAYGACNDGTKNNLKYKAGTYHISANLISSTMFPDEGVIISFRNVNNTLITNLVFTESGQKSGIYTINEPCYLSILTTGATAASNTVIFEDIMVSQTDHAYTPYINSVEERLETVESGVFKSIKKVTSDGVKTYSDVFSELFSDITGTAKYYILYNNSIFTMSAKTTSTATFSRIVYDANTIYISALLIKSNSSATFTEAEITTNGVTFNDYSTDVMSANLTVELAM